MNDKPAPKARKKFLAALSREQEAFDRTLKSPPSRSASSATKVSSNPRWLENAPLKLIELYEKGGNRPEVLGRLLQDRRMVQTWDRIERRRVNTNALLFTYSALWGAILTALSRANRAEGRRKAGQPTLHAETKAHAHKASKLASRLAAHLEKDGPLDFLAHTLFPDDVERLALMVIRNRNLNKAGVSLANTTFLEVLAEFQRRADASARATPIVQRVRASERAETKDVRPKTFVGELTPFFKHRFGRPMHSAVAMFTNVALELPLTNGLLPQTWNGRFLGNPRNKKPEKIALMV